MSVNSELDAFGQVEENKNESKKKKENITQALGHKINLGIQKYVVALITSIILDNLFCFTLYFTFNKFSLSNLRTQTADVLLLCLTRTVCAPILVYCAAKYGKPDFHAKNPHILSTFQKYSLLSAEDADEPLKEEQAEKTAKIFKNVLVFVIFALFTFCLIFVGVKCVILNFGNGGMLRLQEVSMISLVFMLNLELFLCTEIVARSVKETGFLIPNLHAHTMYLSKEYGGLWCDLCDTPVTEGTLSCGTCHFDICKNCTEKDKASIEGLMRNDKGILDICITSMTYFKTCFGFVKRNGPVVCVALLCLLLSSLANILMPNFQGNILDQVIKYDMNGFHKYIILYIIANALLGVFSAVQTYCFKYLGKKMYYDIQVELVDNVLKQDIAFFDGNPSGILINRLCYESEEMMSPVNQVLSTFLSAIVLLFGGIFMCLYTSWRLSVLAFTTIGPITLLYREYAQVSRKVTGSVWDITARSQTIIAETLQNVRTLRSFTQEATQEEKYRKSRARSLKCEVKLVGYEAVTTLINSYMENIITVLVLWYGGILAMEDSTVMSIGSLITFQLYWNLISTNYEIIVQNASSFTIAEGAANHVLQLLSCKPAIDPAKGTECTAIGDIELKDVVFHYQMRPSEIVLKGLNLKIKRGQVVALVGKSGCGKSTIANLLQRFYDPKEGSILLDGVDIRTLNPISYRSHIGVVAQDTQLLNESILDNITLSQKQAYTMEQVIDAAKKANAHDFIMEKEFGYEMNVGENGSRLSGGQRQRIALARAFLKNPSLLLLDEATSALDAESESLVQDAIDKLIAGRKCSVVLVAHRLSTIVGADLIAVVADGKVAESGTHSELMALGGMYARLVEKQTKKYQNLIADDDEDD